MANTESEVQAALNSVNAPYAEAAKRDILNALSEFCDLYPGTDAYVFNDGSCRQVVTLTGTVPIVYKGSTYNIPLCFYLLDTHPYNAPICYVRPTPDMMIRTSQHVDASGKVSLPYLWEWRHPKSDLYGLLQILVIVFGDQCPVFSKSSSASMVNVMGGPSGTTTPSSASYHSYQQMPSSVPRPLQPYGGYGTTNSPAGTSQAAFGAFGGFSSPNAYSVQRPPGQTAIPSEHGGMNLILAVEEKLRSKLRDSMGSLYTDLQSIRKTREDLINGEQKLKAMSTKMAEEQEYFDTMVVGLQGTIGELDKILLEAGVGEESRIDDAIDTTTPLFRQLLNAYVEDNAIEDTIYFLGQALKRGRMDLENYLKHVRILSRQQFMLRATMQRCRLVAGMDI